MASDPYIEQEGIEEGHPGNNFHKLRMNERHDLLQKPSKTAVDVVGRRRLWANEED